MKKYFVYLDDGKDAYRIAVPANNEKEAKDFCEGNGEVVGIKDVTEKYPISKDKVAEALFSNGFGDIEVDLITRAL